VASQVLALGRVSQTSVQVAGAVLGAGVVDGALLGAAEVDGAGVVDAEAEGRGHTVS
jgi:hypothetical protein